MTQVEVAESAQLAVVGRGSNTCVYVIVIFTCVKVPNNTFASSFVLKLEKPQQKRINYCSKHMGTTWRQKAIFTVVGSLVSTTKEGAPGAKQTKGHVIDVF